MSYAEGIIKSAMFFLKIIKLLNVSYKIHCLFTIVVDSLLILHQEMRALRTEDCKLKNTKIIAVFHTSEVKKGLCAM